MTDRLRAAHLLLLLGPAALLGGAFAFQHIGGLHPCEMCIWQRWPHVAQQPAVWRTPATQRAEST